MQFFYKNVYSNLVQQKFLTSSLPENKVFVEIKFQNVENLDEESILKSFYFFTLIFNVLPSLKNFNSRYHLGKTFYTFQVFHNFNALSLDLFLLYYFFNNINEPDKITFNSQIHKNSLELNLSDLKSFVAVESNPHFFKWEKDLLLNCSINGYKNKNLINFYFFFMENVKYNNFNNFWSYYVS